MYDESMYQKVLKKVRTGSGDAVEKKIDYFQDKVTFPANVRYSYARDGAVLILHDVPITKVGVQPYYDADGKLEMHFKTPEAVGGIKSDFAPMAFVHPPLHFRDMSDDQIKEWMVGWTSDGRYDAETQKRYADLYFTVSSLLKDARGAELIQRVKDGKSTDVSIGFFVETQNEKGTYDGRAYDVKQTMIDYDHLAVLVDQQGRYSYPDGVGIGADTLTETSNGGKHMGEEPKDMSPAADVLARELADEKTARQDAEAKATAALDAAKKAEDALKQLQDEIAKREADEHVQRVDAFVKQLQAKSLKKDTDLKEWSDFLTGLTKTQMVFLEKNMGDGVIVKENKILFSVKSNDSNKSVEKDHFKDAQEAAKRKWEAQNGTKA